MITAHNISLSLGAQTIFTQISFFLSQKSRVGLVGRNGSGKSTLLKIISGLQHVDNGSLSFSKGKRIAYVPQELVLESGRTILQEAFRAWGEIAHLNDLIAKLETYDLSTDIQRAQEYAAAQDELTLLQPEQALAETKSILQGLGFSTQQFDESVQTLSVGWKMRLILAKQLLTKADFYLFDEPTNHLDLQTKDWFISFLQDASFGFLLVCHERYVLDKLCTNILALEHARASYYQGNYSHYETIYQSEIEQLHHAKMLQEKEIAKKRATIERFRASATKAKMAQSMLKELEKIEIIQVPPAAKQINFSFNLAQKSGRVVLSVSNVAHQFGERKLFEQVSFEIEREQKVAIIAPNGAGKSTLLALIMGKQPLQNGTITFGYQVTPGFFEQDQTRSLQLSASILENILDSCQRSEQYVRSLLGSFLFTNEDVYKKAGVLSGGEKNRLGMAKLLVQDLNFLILDEPTNHLDIISKEILVRALKAYQGALLFVSHDHTFINALATHVIELNPSGTVMYHGNYQQYQEFQRKNQKEVFLHSSPKKSTIHTHQSEQLPTSPSLKKVEQTIAKWEREVTRISESFADLTYATEEFSDAQEKLEYAQKQLQAALTIWESLYQ